MLTYLPHSTCTGGWGQHSTPNITPACSRTLHLAYLYIHTYTHHSLFLLVQSVVLLLAATTHHLYYSATLHVLLCCYVSTLRGVWVLTKAGVSRGVFAAASAAYCAVYIADRPSEKRKQQNYKKHKCNVSFIVAAVMALPVALSLLSLIVTLPSSIVSIHVCLDVDVSDGTIIVITSIITMPPALLETNFRGELCFRLRLLEPFSSGDSLPQCSCDSENLCHSASVTL